MPVTLAKRLVAIILLAIGMPVRDAVELTGLCEKSMWTLKKQLRGQAVSELMTIKSGSGRRRYNVLGALDYVSKKILVVANDSYITTTEVCAMLRKVAAEYSGKKSISYLITQGIKNATLYKNSPHSWIYSLITYRHTAQTLT